jgi:hypothetical protein
VFILSVKFPAFKIFVSCVFRVTATQRKFKWGEGESIVCMQTDLQSSSICHCRLCYNPSVKLYKITAMKPAVTCTTSHWLVTTVLHLIYGAQSITHLSLYFTMPVIILTDLEVSKRPDQPIGPHLRSHHPADPSFVCIPLPAETKCHSVFFVLWAGSYASSSKEFKPVPILSVYLICFLSLSISLFLGQISEKFDLIGCQLTTN